MHSMRCIQIVYKALALFPGRSAKLPLHYGLGTRLTRHANGRYSDTLAYPLSALPTGGWGHAVLCLLSCLIPTLSPLMCDSIA